MKRAAAARRSTPPPSAARADDTRARLLAEARDLFLASGPEHVGLREVARRAGVSAAAVYRHFDGKEALLDAACTEGFHVFHRYLLRAAAEGTPRARLLASSEQYRRFALENPEDYRFLFMSPAKGAGRPAATPTVDAPSRKATFQFLVDRVRECIDAGVLADGPPEETAYVIWAHVHGLVSLRLSGHDGGLGDHAFAAVYRASVERLLRGLA